MFRRLLSELKRRKVTNVAVAYAAVGAAVTEAVNNVSPALGLPLIVLRATVVAILVGFPVALALAWFLRVAPEAPAPEASEDKSESAPSGRAPWGSLAGWALAGLLLVVLAWRGLSSRDSTATALAAVSEVQDAMARSEWILAYRLANELPDAIPDTVRQSLLESATLTKDLTSDPPGARVCWRPYGDPDADCEFIGTTPIDDWPAPRAAVALRFDREGYVSRTVAIGVPPYLPEVPSRRPATSDYGDIPEKVRLRSEKDIFPDAVSLAGGYWPTALSDSRLRAAPQVALDPFLIDRYEVTNEEYQEFVNAGGYRDSTYWVEPIVQGGRVLSFAESRSLFLEPGGDKPGPSTWVGGTYPKGEGDHPVGGVSWYEAAAYARFRVRELPTLYHWALAARTWTLQWVVPRSNFQAADTTWEVGRSEVSPYGLYDVAGNVREWVYNATDALRITVGGGYDDPRWMFGRVNPQPPLDRSATNGFRLMRNEGSPENLEAARVELHLETRDYSAETPVGEEAFQAFRKAFSYDKSQPLNDTILHTDTTQDWIHETIRIDPGYPGDPLLLHLMRPPSAPSRPLQTVVLFPASWAENVSDIDSFLETDDHVRFLVRSGRAVAVPSFEGILERRYPTHVNPSESNEYTQKIIHNRADLGRSLDYLETRPDIDHESFSFFGVSSSAVYFAPIALAVEPRLRVAALVTVGLPSMSLQPGVDPINFLPHVTVPVRMMNGVFDGVVDPDRASRPYYRLLGTDEARKDTVWAESSHTVPTPQLTQWTLEWLDRWLGKVR